MVGILLAAVMQHWVDTVGTQFGLMGECQIHPDAQLVYPLGVVVMISSELVAGLGSSEIRYTVCGYKLRLVLLHALVLPGLLTFQTHYLSEVILQSRRGLRHNLGCLRLSTLE